MFLSHIDVSVSLSLSLSLSPPPPPPSSLSKINKTYPWVRIKNSNSDDDNDDVERHICLLCEKKQVIKHYIWNKPISVKTTEQSRRLCHKSPEITSRHMVSTA